MMLNRNCGHPCLIPSLMCKSFSLPLLNMILAKNFSQRPFVSLSKFFSQPPLNLSLSSRAWALEPDYCWL